jgi:hypothetical protein
MPSPNAPLVAVGGHVVAVLRGRCHLLLLHLLLARRLGLGLALGRGGLGGGLGRLGRLLDSGRRLRRQLLRALLERLALRGRQLLPLRAQRLRRCETQRVRTRKSDQQTQTHQAKQRAYEGKTRALPISPNLSSGCSLMSIGRRSLQKASHALTVRGLAGAAASSSSAAAAAALGLAFFTTSSASVRAACVHATRQRAAQRMHTRCAGGSTDAHAPPGVLRLTAAGLAAAGMTLPCSASRLALEASAEARKGALASAESAVHSAPSACEQREHSAIASAKRCAGAPERHA